MNMKRKEFLKSLALVAATPILFSCTEEDIVPDDGTDGNNTGDCTLTPNETEGPFPTKNPSSLERIDIRADRTGTELKINITIQNKNNGCSGLEGALVDIWHCDKDGYYSEYGGSGMQNVNFTNVHFLRGRQQTDSDGLVTFTSIFPGWYRGRATHIHVHIYDASGKSLLVTQIAFPSEITDTVYTSATNYYTSGKQDTSNDNDNVFGDGYEQELATITGNISDGFELTHVIVVEA